jgi:hypothetical protein
MDNIKLIASMVIMCIRKHFTFIIKLIGYIIHIFDIIMTKDNMILPAFGHRPVNGVFHFNHSFLLTIALLYTITNIVSSSIFIIENRFL